MAANRATVNVSASLLPDSMKTSIGGTTVYDLNDTEMIDLIKPSLEEGIIAYSQEEAIEEICKTGKPVIMSTGCSTVEEIDKAVNLIRSYHENLVLLHSTTSYPTNDEDINFNSSEGFFSHLNISSFVS